MLFWCFFQFVSGCLCRTVGLGFIEGWCCFRAYIGLYSSGDQRTRRVKEQTGGPDQGNLKLFVPQFYIFSMVLPGNLDSFPVSSSL